MIDPKELRIGNWVLTRGGKMELGNVYPVKLERINKQNLHLYNPIPLTPEILGKCGFLKLCSDEYMVLPYFTLKKDSVVGTADDEVFLQEWYLYLGTEKEELNQYECKYLHQLQNFVFFMTGQELEFTP
jgi:hypothetical protein